MKELFQLMIELDKLKSVYRRSYITGEGRRENSAEHSWHLAMALYALQPQLPAEVNFEHAIKMAIMHDICEIGAGDISVYHPDRHLKPALEEGYLSELAARFPELGDDVLVIWREYEAQESAESRWVKVVDRTLPFMLNIATEGRNWIELGIKKEQVVNLNRPLGAQYPALWEWISAEIDKAVVAGWLIDA